MSYWLSDLKDRYAYKSTASWWKFLEKKKKIEKLAEVNWTLFLQILRYERLMHINKLVWLLKESKKNKRKTNKFRLLMLVCVLSKLFFGSTHLSCLNTTGSCASHACDLCMSRVLPVHAACACPEHFPCMELVCVAPCTFSSAAVLLRQLAFVFFVLLLHSPMHNNPYAS